MSKIINIVARTNGVGLDNDVSLLKTILELAGHSVSFSHCRSRKSYHNWLPQAHLYDANIFLERIFPVWSRAAKTNILIPNQERFPKRHLKRLKYVDHVLCKSHHAKNVFSTHFNSTHYIGFTSKDRYADNIQPNYSQFFHLAGSSTLKGTATVLELWEAHPEWPTLTLLQHKKNAPERVPNNVNLITDRISDCELTKLANTHGIHLCPSRSEGWGHYIVEAMSCTALVVTTDAPPMNELVNTSRGVIISYDKSSPRHLGTNYQVDKVQLEAGIQDIISMPCDKKLRTGKKAREWFIENHNAFQVELTKLVNSII